MEEKKHIKISLSTVLLILAIIVIIIMAYFIYKLNNEKTVETKTVANLNNEVSNLQSTVNNLNDKINNLSNTNNNSENTNTNNSETIISSDKALVLAQNTLKKYGQLERYKNSNIGPMPEILEELGLETKQQIESEVNKINDSSTYIKSKTKYKDFKNEMLKYITEEFLNENYSQYKNIDEYVAFCNCGGSIPTTNYENIKFIKMDENLYEFTATVRDEEMYEHYKIGENAKFEFTYKIIFKYINENMVISSINLIK